MLAEHSNVTIWHNLQLNVYAWLRHDDGQYELRFVRPKVRGVLLIGYHLLSLQIFWPIRFLLLKH